jgi:hypothetical protein
MSRKSESRIFRQVSASPTFLLMSKTRMSFFKPPVGTRAYRKLGGLKILIRSSSKSEFESSPKSSELASIVNVELLSVKKFLRSRSDSTRFRPTSKSRFLRMTSFGVCRRQRRFCFVGLYRLYSLFSQRP